VQTTYRKLLEAAVKYTGASASFICAYMGYEKLEGVRKANPWYYC